MILTNNRPRAISIAACLTIGLLSGLSGCATTRAHRHELDRNGLVFYVDGAGGGNALKDYGRGVEQGLRQAGFDGDFLSFSWHTGLGVAADQTASVEYKRSKAKELAKQIVDFRSSHPGSPVHLVGLSAGTAVAVFALEELPTSAPVDSVTLLGSSLSSHYDITEALKRVNGRLSVYTSEKDAVLGVLVPISGTADRKYCGACSAGLRGFHLPEDADADVMELYDKVTNVNWRPEFAESGHNGGHTDAVNAVFVERHVAPIILNAPRLIGPHFTDAGA